MPYVKIAKLKRETARFKKGQKVFICHIHRDGSIGVLGRYKNIGEYAMAYIHPGSYKIMKKGQSFEVTQKFAYHLYKMSAGRLVSSGLVFPKKSN